MEGWPARLRVRDPRIYELQRSRCAKIKAPTGLLFSFCRPTGVKISGNSHRAWDDYKRIIRSPRRNIHSRSAPNDKRTRGIFMEWRDRLALKSRRQADYAWTVLARVLRSKDRGKSPSIRVNAGAYLQRIAIRECLECRAGSGVPQIGANTLAFATVARPLDRATPRRSSAIAVVCLQRNTNQVAAVQDWCPRSHSCWNTT